MFKLDTSTPNYSHINAYVLSQLCYYTYFTPELLIERLNTLSIKHEDIIYVNKRDNYSLIIITAEEVIIVIRGSDTVQDWLLNAQLLLTSYSKGKVHQGFYEVFKQLYTDIEAPLKKEIAKGKKIYITGHSLGGAVGILVADKLINSNIPVHSIYTFGQPRVGDYNYAKYIYTILPNNYYRIVNNSDIVPRTPPRNLGYTHSGLFVYFDSKGIFRPTMYWSDVLSNKVDELLDNLYNPGLVEIKDHDIGEYITNYNNLLSPILLNTIPTELVIKRKV